jgi:hypothetical protein
MFLWENLLPSCHGCNRWECKGPSMKWGADDRPLMLDPAADGDDPLCYFAIEHEESSKLELGWVEIQSGLRPEAVARADYTRRTLKLNLRTVLLRGRARTIRRFKELEACLDVLGPDFEAPTGHSVRQKFREMLDAREPYLAPVRQILRRDPALRKKLIDQMPELEAVLDAWDLPPDDCALLQAQPAVTSGDVATARE